MASRAKNKTAPSADEKAAGGPRRFRWYRPSVLLALALLLTAGVALPRLSRWLPDLSGRSEYRLNATDIRITQPPHWVPHDLVEQVVENADLPSELSILDENVTRDVADAFRLHPWVEEVELVTKSFPAAITVKLTYRRPVAMVQLKQGTYPVDTSGVLLPPHDFSVADTKLYPLIAGVLSTPQGPAGTDWGDPVVADGARLAAELSGVWKKLRLTSIVCPRVPGRPGALDEGVFTLTAEGGSRILWGRAPGSDHPGELSTGQKIGRLNDYVSKFGGFDRPHGPYEIDIRHWRDISRTPLSAGRDAPDTLRE